MPSRIVGILGGMGPAATVDFYNRLVRATPAARDQDHLRVVIWADPTVPSRQEALFTGGADPTSWLEEGVQHLMRCGAEILVVPCNTVHAYMPSVVEGKAVEFISIIDAAVDAVSKLGSTNRVGILATNGALASGVYQSALRDAGKEAILPSASSQQTLMHAIDAVKAGEAGFEEIQQVVSLLTEFQSSGVSTVIVGCTEISILVADLDVAVTVVDASEVLALKAIERARATRNTLNLGIGSGRRGGEHDEGQ